MQRDKNLKGGREYLIRSLYFDNLYEKVLKEKLSGTAIRDKFRIRYYDFDTAFISLHKGGQPSCGYDALALCYGILQFLSPFFFHKNAPLSHSCFSIRDRN